MRNKILSLMAVAILVSGVAFAYPEPTMEGARKVNNLANDQKSAYREIKLVRWNGINLPWPTSGDALVYDLNSDDGVTVKFTTTSADGGFAGICVTQIPSVDSVGPNFGDDAGRANWGYIVIHGPANANVTAGGTNANGAGDAFITSTDSGKIAGLRDPAGTSNVTQIGLVQAVRGTGGFFMDAADSSSTQVEVFVENE